uniref:Bm204 n=1 Tax=Brugia malayi TaxID=6279 RepID=A0A0J9XMW2_BRUMA|nr:Bm204 [Brugia malayi]
MLRNLEGYSSSFTICHKNGTSTNSRFYQYRGQRSQRSEPSRKEALFHKETVYLNKDCVTSTIFIQTTFFTWLLSVATSLLMRDNSWATRTE